MPTRPPRSAGRAAGFGAPALLAALAALCLAAPFGLLLAHTLAGPPADVTVHGDLALIELSTVKAARFEQILGPYSRFKMHHPGPALFYWLAPFHQLGGQRYGALCLGILALNAAAFATLALVPWRLAKSAGLLLAAPFLALLALHGGPPLLWSIWNPEAAVLPFAASAICAFAVAAGRPNFLPAGVFFGLFAAQCHVLYLPPVAALWLAALALAIRHGRGRPLPRCALAASAAIALSMLWPVALEEWRGEPGNISLILHLKGATEDKALGREALAPGAAAAAEAFWSPFGYRGGRRLEGAAVAGGVRTALALLAAAALAAGLAWRWRSPLLPALLVWLALSASALWALASLSGPFHSYFTRFLVPLGPLTAILFGTALLAAGRPQTQRAAAVAKGAALAATAAVSFLLCRDVVRTPPLAGFLEEGWGAGAYGPATARILEALAEENIGSPYIGLYDEGHWQYAAAIANQVEKRGGHVLVYEDWEYMFGAEHSRGAHDGLLLIDAIASAGEAPPPPARTLAEAPLFATLIPLPAAFARSGRSCIGAGDEDAELFLRSGFYPPEIHPGEPAIIWSRYDVSRLSVRLLPRRAYRLSFEAAPYEFALPQKAALALGGRDLAELEITPGWRRYSVELPAELVGEANEIELRYAKTAVPRDVSASQDHRTLALSFRAFCLDER